MYVRIWYSDIPEEVVAAQRFFEITSSYYWLSFPLAWLWISLSIAALAMKKIRLPLFLFGILLPPALSFILARILLMLLVHFSVNN